MVDERTCDRFVSLLVSVSGQLTHFLMKCEIARVGTLSLRRAAGIISKTVGRP